jgi:hypothetical protein
VLQALLLQAPLLRPAQLPHPRPLVYLLSHLLTLWLLALLLRQQHLPQHELSLFGFACIAGQGTFEEMLDLSQAGRSGNRKGNSAAHAEMDGAFTGWFLLLSSSKGTARCLVQMFTNNGLYHERAMKIMKCNFYLKTNSGSFFHSDPSGSFVQTQHLEEQCIADMSAGISSRHRKTKQLARGNDVHKL